MAKTEITVTLYPSEIQYDIENKTYLHARTDAEGDNIVAASDAMVDGSDEADNHVSRSMGNAVTTLLSRLSEYAATAETSADNILKAPSEPYVIKLLMPANFNKAATLNLGATMHQFVVNQAIGDWYAETDSESSQYYAALASANLDTIREITNKRERPVRDNTATT